jgi:hypothetical protein
MAFLKAEKLPGEPIIISTYTGFVNAQDIREGVVEIARLSQTIEGRVYAISVCPAPRAEGDNFTVSCITSAD